MQITQQAEIDPNEAMAGLEEGYVEESVVDTGAGNATSNAATTSATTSSTNETDRLRSASSEETPEALAARKDERSSAAAEDEAARNTNSQRTSQAAAGANDRATTTANTGAIANRSSANNSLFDQATQKPEGKVVNVADTDLVMIDGQLVPYGQVKASTVFKPKYDNVVRERDALAAERTSVAQREQKIAGVEPYVKVLEGDTYLRIYTNARIMGRSEDEAHAAAAAATGRTMPTPAAVTQTIDPRLIPPKDEATGEELSHDDPRYLAWLAGPKTEATAEAATKRVLAEAQAERDRQAKAERDRAAERERQTNEANAGRLAIEQENLRVLSHLGDELRARKIDIDAMTPEEWRRTKDIFADQSALYGKDVRSDKFLHEDVLTVGDIQLVLDSKGFLDKLRTNGAMASDKGPGTAAEVVNNGAANNGTNTQAATNGAATNGAASTSDRASGRIAMQNNFARRPLSAGAPSEAIPGQGTGVTNVGSDEDQTLAAMESLG